MEQLDLNEIRGRLDEIDGQITALFEKRMDLCANVAEYKIGVGKPVYDEEREAQKLNVLMAGVKHEYNRKGVRELFSQIMTLSRKLQYRILSAYGQEPDMGFEMVPALKLAGARIVYQGVEGSYGHAAALQYFGRDADVYHVPSMENAMEDVEAHRADYAVLPIENSTAGTVSDNYDMLIRHNVYIVGETKVKVNHALLGLEDATTEDILRVYSHPQALMQCAPYLNSHKDWCQVSLNNTALAAKKVLIDGDRSQAAVASEIAGKLYGLKVLDYPINYNKNNITRFIILSSAPIYCQNAGKVSICFEVSHKSGSLYNMLSNLIYNDVNMLMIESRPIEDKSWAYRFFVDMEGSLSDESIVNALVGIRKEAVYMKILGNY